MFHRLYMHGNRPRGDHPNAGGSYRYDRWSWVRRPAIDLAARADQLLDRVDRCVKSRPTLTPPPKSSTALMLFYKIEISGVIFRAQV